MTIKAGSSHDISFLEPTEDKEIGLMLAWKTNSKGERQYPYYSEIDDPALAQQFYSGEPGYANLPPEKELQLEQDDWRSGVGQEIYDSADDKRYWKSINMDLRFKGIAQCGPLATALSKDDGVIKCHCEYSGEMYIGNGKELQKLNSTGDGWDDVETFDYDITDLEVYGDNLYVALGGDNKYEYTTAAAGDLSLRPNSDISSAEVILPSTGTDLYDCVNEASANDDTDYIYTTSEGGVYWGLPNHTTETGTINYIKVYFRCRYSTTDGTARVGIKTHSTFYWADDTETLTNSYANYDAQWTLNPFTGAAWTWDEADDLQVYLVITSSGQARCTQLYVNVNYASGDQTFVTSELEHGVADFFQVVDATLWKAKKPNELKSAVGNDPTNTGSWSGATTVGSTTYNITDLQEESGQLFAMKEDMPWYLDTDGNPHRLIPALKTLQCSTSGQNSDVWKAKVYIPCGTQSLVEYTSSDTIFIDPADRCNNITEFTGRVQAVTHDERWLFAVTDNDTKVELQATRLESIDGTSTRVWHPLAELTLANCQYAWVSNIYKKRLYIASTDETEDLYYYPLPTDYGDIDSDSNYTFQTGGYFITPWLHANFKADNKAFIKLTLTMADTSDTEYFTAYYRLKGTSDWTEIDDFKTEPTTEKYLAAATTSRSGVMIQFKFEAKTTDDNTITPKLLSYDCRGIWYPTKRKLISCRIKVADSLTPKKGGQETQTAAQIRTAIDAADAATWPITFYDPWGSTHYVKFLSVSKQPTAIEKGRNLEESYDLVLEKVTLS